MCASSEISYLRDWNQKGISCPRKCTYFLYVSLADARSMRSSKHIQAEMSQPVHDAVLPKAVVQHLPRLLYPGRAGGARLGTGH